MILNQNAKILFYISLGLVLLSFFEVLGGPVRYLKYLVLPLTFAIWVDSKDFLKVSLPSFSISFLLFIIISVFYLPSIGISVFKEPLLVFSCLFPFLLIKNVKIDIEYVFNLTIAAMVLANSYRIGGFVSIGGVEDNFCFVFGAFVTYFLMKKDYKRALIALFFVFITLKRIVFLAVVASSILIILPALFRSIILRPYILVLINLFVLLLSCLFVLGAFNEWIFINFDVHPAKLSSARYEIQQIAAEAIYFDLGSFIFSGLGPGASIALGTESWGTFVSLHNDLLKLAVEFGLLFFIIFFYFFYKNLNTEQKILAVYLNVTFATDNTLIYAGVLFFYFLLMYTLKEVNNEHIAAS